MTRRAGGRSGGWRRFLVQGAMRRFVGGPIDDDGGHGGRWILLGVDVRLGPHDIVRRVDPDARVLEASLPEDGRWVGAARGGDGDTLWIPPIDAIATDVVRLSPPPPAPASEQRPSPFPAATDGVHRTDGISFDLRLRARVSPRPGRL